MMKLFTSFGKSKGFGSGSLESFAPAADYPPNCPAVLDRIREGIRKHNGTHWPLYLFFDVEVIGVMPDYKQWEEWDVSSLTEPELAEFPHILQFAWILCDEHRHVYMARNMIVKPEKFEIPPLAEEVHGISHERAVREGMPIREILREFTNCLAPGTRAVTFDGAVDAVITEVQMRRARLNYQFNRLTFYDLRQKTREFCALPNEDDDNPDNPFRLPQLNELYEKLFPEFEYDCHHASADVQVIEKCFFKLLKLSVF